MTAYGTPSQPDSFPTSPSSVPARQLTDLSTQRREVTDDLDRLLSVFPDKIRVPLDSHPRRNTLIEVVMDLGRLPEARFPDASEYLSEEPVSRDDLNHCIQRVGSFSGDNRAGIERTLHRISAIRNRQGEVIGLTCRVGRAVFGTIGMIGDLVETGKSILMLGRPGVGKTTALREIARVLADDLNKRVVIIDTSNEIAGDGDIPHPALGRARRMQVARPELQHQVMIEAVENHMPEVIVIDEIGTELEALAARTIAERGVQLVGTAHGNSIENLIKNPTLSDLIGGIQSVTLGDDEARRRGSQKSVLERKAPPTFGIAVEMLERQRWLIHEEVSQTVDILLRRGRPRYEIRSVNEDGQVVSVQEAGAAPPKEPTRGSRDRWRNRRSSSLLSEPESLGGWRESGRMSPLPSGSSPLSPSTEQTSSSRTSPPLGEFTTEPKTDHQAFEQLLNTTLPASADLRSGNDFLDPPPLSGPDGQELPIHVYPYAISRNLLEQVIETLNLPVVLTKDLDQADTVLALRSHLKNHSKLRQMAGNRQLAIHAVKSNSMPQVLRALKRMLNMDDPYAKGDDAVNLNLFARSGEEDEIEALEEARLAVEQIVIPKGQPVELLPRSPKVRKMQHELVEHYRLKSSSFGDEPNRRLRIYPA